MAFLEIPKKLFDLELSGISVKKLLSSVLSDIIEVEISKGSGGILSGYIVGRKGDDIIVRTFGELDKSRSYEIRFISSKGIISINSKIIDEIRDTFPKMYIIKSPEKLFICERRKYYRVKLRGDGEVVIKRESGYAFFCRVKDISLGGFSASMHIKDKMVEYFLPLVNEEVKFSLKLAEGKRSFELEGLANLKHYSVSSSGEYRAGFSFSKLERRYIRELSEFIKRKMRKAEKKK